MSGDLVKRMGLLCMLVLAVAPDSSSAQAPAKPASRAQEPVGRLFFTPAQRASLDVARTRRARTTLNNEDEQNTPVAQTITYGGMVRRSDGKSTMWVNNRAMSDNEAATGAVIGRVRPDGSITLQLPQSGRSVNLKPGQSIELLSGVIEEGYSRRPATPETKPITKPAPEAQPDKQAATERSRDQRDSEEQRRKLEDVVQALQEAAAARTAPPGPPQPPSR